MKRQDFLKTVGLGATVLATQQRALFAQKSKSSRPNVILVITDDQGYGDLACHGHPVLKTPNLDRLHGQSVRLTNFHVAPTCSPTRAGLMTGRYCNRTGVWHTIMGRSLLRQDEVTMADVFAAAGYHTGIFGKWHLGDNYPFRPQDRGFHEALVHKGGGIGNIQDYWDNDYFDDGYFRNGKPEKFTGYCADVWFGEAMKFVEANKDRPFFCYLTSNTAHGPYLVDEKYSRPYKQNGIKSPLAEYYGMVTNIDDNMGQLMKKLDALGLSDDTILIFMTDNGATPVRRTTSEYNAGMRGWKGSEYDGGHRVPCFIRWPGGGLSGGRDIGRLTAHLDLLPSLIDLCGLKKPGRVKSDGRSLTPLFSRQGRSWPDRILVTDSQRVDYPIKWRKSAVMSDRWRLVNGKELYAIEEDPGQINDIAGRYPDVVRELRAAYEDWWKDISQDFDDYPAIIIGSENEPTARLTTHDIHGQVVWNQRQVLNGQHCDGFWAVEIAKDGKYAFTLRRWPEEANAPITGIVSGGKAVEATNARLKIADVDMTRLIGPEDRAITFTVPLKAGRTRLQAWFADGKDDGRSNGVYYVSVKRIP